PAAERFLSLSFKRHTTGLLYAANTAGAACGAIGAAFWLMPHFGLRLSLVLFAITNLGCGAVGLWMAKSVKLDEGPPRDPAKWNASWATRLILSGLLGIGFEVALIRGLSHVLENTVYTFAVVLGIYLVGNAVGAAIFQISEKIKTLGTGALFGVLSIATLLSAIGLRWSPAVYGFLRTQLGDSITAVAIAEAACAGVFFFVPAVVMGATWSSLVQGTLIFKPSLAWAVALNTAGAAAAPAVIGILIMPAIGLKGAFVLIALGYALLIGNKRWIVITALGVLLFSPAVTSVRNLVETKGAFFVNLKEGVIGSVAVLEDPATGERALKFNNRFQMGGTAARVAEERQATIPLLLHPSPNRSLFIGLGTGITFAATPHFHGLAADGVELVPEIAQAVSFFAGSADTNAATNGQRIHIADGRRFVRATQQKYDVIVGDLFHPAQDGAGFLYTLEHFKAVREKLARDGLFCQWLPVYQMDSETLRIVMATFKQVFPNAELWLLRFNIDLPVIGLVGREAESSYSWNTVESKLAANTVSAEHLKSVGLSDSLRLFGCFIGPLPSFESRINTDLNPILIFDSAAITFQKRDDPATRLLDLLVQFRGSPIQLISNAPTNFTARLDAFSRARDIYLKGLFLALQNPSAGTSALIESVRASSDFTQSYAQALGIASSLAQTDPANAKRILEALIEAQPERPVAKNLLNRINAQSQGK
ncbi:MAG TPA: fused MFS/spermidine synthase, partial [Candidatus Kapabacteria bacterium]|nr:fused MFS/spermidine synthase [Candidatus Kapabacteria bacterium]